MSGEIYYIGACGGVLFMLLVVHSRMKRDYDESNDDD